MDREITLDIYVYIEKEKQHFEIKEKRETILQEIVEELEIKFECSDDQIIRLYQGQRQLENENKLGDLTQENYCKLEGRIFNKITNQEVSSTDGMINIKIVYPETNRSYAYYVNLNWKINKLMEQLQQVVGQAPQGLLFEHKALDPNKTFAKEGLHDGDSLTYLAKQGGGMIQTFNI